MLLLFLSPCSHQPLPPSFLHVTPSATSSYAPLCPAAREPLDLDKPNHHASGSDSHSPVRYNDPYTPGGAQRDRSPEYSSSEPKINRHPRQDPGAPHSRSRYPEHHLVAEGGSSRQADPYPEHLLPPRGKHGDRYPEHQPTETGRARGQRGEEAERAVRRKEKPARPPQPQSPIERDKGRHKERDYWERDLGREKNRRRDGERDRHQDRDRGRDLGWGRDGERERRRDGEREPRQDKERDRDGQLSSDRHRERDRQRERDKDGHRTRTRSRERGLEKDSEPVSGHSRDRPREDRVSWEEGQEGDDDDGGERERRGRQRVHSGPGEVFEEHWSEEGRGERKEPGDPHHWVGPGRERSHTHPPTETGTTPSPTTGPRGLVWVCVWCWGVHLVAFFFTGGNSAGGGLNTPSITITNRDTVFFFCSALCLFFNHLGYDDADDDVGDDFMVILDD